MVSKKFAKVERKKIGCLITTYLLLLYSAMCTGGIVCTRSIVAIETVRPIAPSSFLNTNYFAANTSTSTNAPFGKSFTATAERAGNGCSKKVEYTSFIAVKLAISERKTVVFTT